MNTLRAVLQFLMDFELLRFSMVYKNQLLPALSGNLLLLGFEPTDTLNLHHSWLQLYINISIILNIRITYSLNRILVSN